MSAGPRGPISPSEPPPSWETRERERLLAEFPVQCMLGREIRLDQRPPDLLIVMYRQCGLPDHAVTKLTAAVCAGETVLIVARNIVVMDMAREQVLARMPASRMGARVDAL